MNSCRGGRSRERGQVPASHLHQYHNTLAVRRKLYYFLEMLKFSKNTFRKEIIFVKENEWSFEILRNILFYWLFGRCLLKLLMYFNIQVLKVPLPSSTHDTTTFISQRAGLTFTNPIQNLKSHHNHAKNPWRRNKKHSKAKANSSITPTHIHIYSVHWCKRNLYLWLSEGEGRGYLLGLIFEVLASKK
jgi:hypothetical protein